MLKFGRATRMSTVELACLFRESCYPHKSLANVYPHGVMLWNNPDSIGDNSQTLYTWHEVIMGLSNVGKFWIAD